MNVDQLQRKLWAVARALPRDEHVPYAFERRVMASLFPAPLLDPMAIWSRLLWRAAAPCVGIMLVVSVWTVLANTSLNSPATLAADLERTVWGPLASLNEYW